eukprot:Tamp_21399.p1 GENE.Tamp_21399~~Tamp_21399.p1  ORF type:complete len:289 (-),score=7.06 Tamp_21399:104-970(-)
MRASVWSERGPPSDLGARHSAVSGAGACARHARTKHEYMLARTQLIKADVAHAHAHAHSSVVHKGARRLVLPSPRPGLGRRLGTFAAISLNAGCVQRQPRSRSPLLLPSRWWGERRAHVVCCRAPLGPHLCRIPSRATMACEVAGPALHSQLLGGARLPGPPAFASGQRRPATRQAAAQVIQGQQCLPEHGVWQSLPAPPASAASARMSTLDHHRYAPACMSARSRACARARERAGVRACGRAGVRACVQASMRACVHACGRVPDVVVPIRPSRRGAHASRALAAARR